MKKIKFILVNDGAAGPRGSAAEPRFNAALPRFKVQGSLTKVRATRGSMTKIKVQSGFAAGQSGSEREGLIEELCRLRKLYPKAKILGVSELGEHCVHPSERMNQLRRELSDLGGGAAGQCGGAAVQRAEGPVQGSKFSDLKVQSDLKVDDKVTTSDIILLTSDIFFEHPLLFSNIPRPLQP